MHPVDMLAYWAAATPARPAIVQPDMVVTYQGLLDAIASIGERIDELGLQRNEPVAVCIEHPAKLLGVSLTLLHRGYSVAPVNRAELLYLQPFGIKTLIYDAQGFLAGSGRNIRFEDSWLRRPDGAPPAAMAPKADRQGAVILFALGATGRPHKIVQTWESQLHGLYAACLAGNAEASTVLLMAGPRDGTGFTRACEALYRGRTVCFCSSPRAAASLAALFQVDLIVAAPAQAAALVDYVEDNPGYEFPALQTIRIVGGRISKERAARMQSTLSGKIEVEYGAPETGTVALAPYEAVRNITGAVGIAVPWADVEIVDSAGTVLPHGQEGAIRCRTPVLVKSFAANDPLSTASCDAAWWYPGDRGRLDTNGMLCVTGRSDDLIDHGEARMTAAALDEIVGSFAGLHDAAACGVPNAEGLDELWIAVVPQSAADLAAMKRSIEASGKLPMPIDRMFALAQIPRNALGKVERQELREKLRALSAQPPLPAPAEQDA